MTSRRYTGIPAYVTACRYTATVLHVRILAVGSPKGGVGKSTLAGTLAALSARVLKLRTLLVDADENRTALDWLGDDPDVDVAAGLDSAELSRLRDAQGYDLAVIDLPGARAGAFEAVLVGSDGRPVPDLLLVPCLVDLIDLRPTIRVVEGEVAPLGLDTLLAFTRVPYDHLRLAGSRKTDLRTRGLIVADTLVQKFVAYPEALEEGKTVLDIPGRHHRARRAESDIRQLGVEVLGRLGLDVRPLSTGVL